MLITGFIVSLTLLLLGIAHYSKSKPREHRNVPPANCVRNQNEDNEF
jgi:hypothetical protein